MSTNGERILVTLERVVTESERTTRATEANADRLDGLARELAEANTAAAVAAERERGREKALAELREALQALQAQPPTAALDGRLKAVEDAQKADGERLGAIEGDAKRAKWIISGVVGFVVLVGERLAGWLFDLAATGG